MVAGRRGDFMRKETGIEEKDGNFFKKNVENINRRLMFDLILSELEIENLYVIKVPNITLLNLKSDELSIQVRHFV